MDLPEEKADHKWMIGQGLIATGELRVDLSMEAQRACAMPPFFQIPSSLHSSLLYRQQLVLPEQLTPRDHAKVIKLVINQRPNY